MSAGSEATPDPALDPGREATAAQVRASRPGASSWVAANAGSGKTSVLTRRVARLLLDRCPPEKILCLTYTRAAAAEMQTRLFDMLGRWSLQDDADLTATLEDLGLETAPGPEELAQARRLFAKALETPGGLKIQTIHAFCAALLRRFPLEAGTPPDFRELDDRTLSRMLDALRDRMAEAAEAGAAETGEAETGAAETGEGSAFDAAGARLPEQGMEELTDAVLRRRDWFPETGAGAALAAVYGVAPGESLESGASRILAVSNTPDLAALAEALAGGGRTDQALAEDLAAAGAARRAGDVLAVAACVEAAGLTKSGTPRSTRSLPSRAVRDAAPWTAEAVERLIEQAVALRELRAAHEGLEKSRDLHRFAAGLLALYAAEKARLGAIDFDDLVRIAGRLLTEADMAAWVLFKLDGGLDHILIDEAQDTSPEQWRLVRALAEEFFAGAGARETPRTIFAVGDEKQSIYSFQGAEPREFGRMRDLFRARLAAAEGLQETSLAFSFRSAPALLRLVDAVFAAAPEGLSADGAPPAHRAFHLAAPGRVDLWPLFQWAEEPEERAWDDPVDAPAPAAPRARLARALAAHVRAMLDAGEPMPDRKAEGGWRPMRPGDVMILLRRRRGFAPELISQLKARGVEVAGADRLLLESSLAVRDLMSLLRVALDRDDDLSTAEVLRSPLGMASEEDLYDLARDRRPSSLYARVQARAEDFPLAAALLSDITGRADFARPYELIDRALTRHGGRARIRARLNPEEEDAADELLAQALAYEQAETPTLAGFLAWMEAAQDLELKREMGGAGDAVRVMTVHGAKGLEAPFVILPDTGPLRAHGPGPVVGHPDGEGRLALWNVSAKSAAAPVLAAQEASRAREGEESRRLLYVALTRAESRVLVCGAAPKRGDVTGSWHDLVAQGMASAGAAEADLPTEAAMQAETAEPALRLAEGWDRAAFGRASERDASSDADRDEAGAVPRPAPPFAVSAAALPPPPAGPVRVNASALGGDDGTSLHAASSAWDRATARTRGDAIHMLLERLPDLAPADPEATAAALLSAAFPQLSEEIRAGCAAEALAALAHPDAAPFLVAEALAEAPVTALLPGGARMAGRIDRLLVEPGRVRLLDWKTGPAPAGPEGAPPSYIRQMAAYRAALTPLHPGAEIEAGLFWTAAGRLDLLPGGLLDAALAGAAAAAVAGGEGEGFAPGDGA